MNRKYARAAALTVILAGLVLFSTPPVNAADEFYQGKTVRFVVGYAPGGGYDTYTRVIARHIHKYIPGNPTVIVENMEGAGSLLAANHVYAKGEPDGLTGAVFNGGMVLQQALGQKGIMFDARQFGWLGAPSKGTPACGVMAYTGIKNLDDLLKSPKEIKFGSTGAGATTDDLPKLMIGLLGAKINVVPGYKGSGPVRVAMQRREVDGICFTWESMRTTARAMLDAEGEYRLIPIALEGKVPDQEVKNVAQFTQVIKDREKLSIFKAWMGPYRFQRPIALPPKTPKDRLQTLRTAFKKTLEDKEFLAEAEKSKLEIDYVSGEEIDQYVDEVLSISSGAREKLQTLIGRAKK
jgi:tripartite-type tricarboxylate transporter receptor subunit TctC